MIVNGAPPCRAGGTGRSPRTELPFIFIAPSPIFTVSAVRAEFAVFVELSVKFAGASETPLTTSTSGFAASSNVQWNIWSRSARTPSVSASFPLATTIGSVSGFAE